MKAPALLLVPSLLTALALTARAEHLLVEAESFAESGGWSLDTQFITTMGSPYLLAHGLGEQVRDATTTVTFPAPGRYRVFVRTFDWVARWDAPGQPGRFEVLVNGTALAETFGTKGAAWGWQGGGEVEIPPGETTLALRDRTGFDGRCDALFFTNDPAETPPNGSEILGPWRKATLGLPEAPEEAGPYDLVVVGGGYAGMGAALSAARAGCKVALIQDRPVLGGNGSSEVRVWAMGYIRRGKFPRIGEIVEEFADKAKKSPGTFEEFGDAAKEVLVRAEKNIDLFLNHHAHRVETENGKLAAVHTFDTRTSRERRFTGQLFVDCTGHGTIGFLAGADTDMTPVGRMGMSNMWRWDNRPEKQTFPETPWALQLAMKDFPYPRDFHGQWFWESGFDKDALGDAEGIRDWNLRAVYGAFAAMKNGDGAAEHPNARLTWLAYIGGPRESRRLLGDVVLNQEDIVGKRDFPDGCVPSTWTIDLHYPKAQYATKYPENPFISYAKHDDRIDRQFGYPVPYRCFYSRNVPNLFMAGRCISVTHEALGTVRVMKTCGMMGEVVGKAAAICLERKCTPREVYAQYLPQLLEMLELPGKARRDTVTEAFTIPDDALAKAGPRGPMAGRDPGGFPGIVVDDTAAQKDGAWTAGDGLKGFFGYGYLYATADSGARIVFEFTPKTGGKTEVRLAYLSHENRGTAVPVTIAQGNAVTKATLDMTKPAPLENALISLGTFQFDAGQPVRVTLATEGAKGFVHADAVQFLPVK